MNKIVFLDFDGVLVNRQSWLDRVAGEAVADPGCVRHLNTILRSTGAKIVVSSSWRIGRTKLEIAAILEEWNVLGELLDLTPIVRETDPTGGRLTLGVTRGQEILAWLKANPELVTDFVILDDDREMEPLMHKLIKTEFATGLEAKHVIMAVERLQPDRWFPGQ